MPLVVTIAGLSVDFLGKFSLGCFVNTGMQFFEFFFNIIIFVSVLYNTVMLIYCWYRVNLMGGGTTPSGKALQEACIRMLHYPLVQTCCWICIWLTFFISPDKNQANPDNFVVVFLYSISSPALGLGMFIVFISQQVYARQMLYRIIFPSWLLPLVLKYDKDISSLPESTDDLERHSEQDDTGYNVSERGSNASDIEMRNSGSSINERDSVNPGFSRVNTNGSSSGQERITSRSLSGAGGPLKLRTSSSSVSGGAASSGASTTAMLQQHVDQAQKMGLDDSMTLSFMNTSFGLDSHAVDSDMIVSPMFSPTTFSMPVDSTTEVGETRISATSSGVEGATGPPLLLSSVGYASFQQPVDNKIPRGGNNASALSALLSAAASVASSNPSRKMVLPTIGERDSEHSSTQTSLRLSTSSNLKDGDETEIANNQVVDLAANLGNNHYLPSSSNPSVNDHVSSDLTSSSSGGSWTNFGSHHGRPGGNTGNNSIATISPADSTAGSPPPTLPTRLQSRNTPSLAAVRAMSSDKSFKSLHEDDLFLIIQGAMSGARNDSVGSINNL